MDEDAVGLTHGVWVALPGLSSLRRQIQTHIRESKSRLEGHTAKSRLDRIFPGLDFGGKYLGNTQPCLNFENCETGVYYNYILSWANVGAYRGSFRSGYDNNRNGGKSWRENGNKNTS
jgi:hypothetical protein